MIKWLFPHKGSSRDRAIRTLKSRLAAEGYDVHYPPDTSSEGYRVGAEIWIPLPNWGAGKSSYHIDKIRAMSEEVAKQFGLTAVGGGPIALENALVFVCCGFRRTPLPQ